MSIERFYDLEADRKNQIIFRRIQNDACPAHMHQSIELVFVLEGRFRVRINGEEAVLKPGEIAFCDSYRTHLYESAGESSIYLLIVPASFAADFQNGENVTFPPVMRGAERRNEKIFALLGQAYGEWDAYNDLMKRGFVSYLFGYLLQGHQTIPRVQNRRDDLLMEILEDIEHNYMDDLHMQGLAARHGYSYHYFSALFNRYIGQGFREYLNGVRVRRVRELMLHGELSVRAAAEACGFANVNTYYRARRLMNDREE